MRLLKWIDRKLRPEYYEKKDFRGWIETIAEDDERIDALYHLLHSEEPECIDWVRSIAVGNKDDLSLITKGEKK